MKFIYLFIIGICLSCIKSVKTEPNDVIIIGRVKNIPASKIYLTDAYQWENLLDSAEYKNNEFRLKYKSTDKFEPFTASLCYITADKRIKKLIFLNNVLSTKEKSYGYDAFYLEKGETVIEGDLSKNIKLSISSGNDTKLLYKYQLANWGYVYSPDAIIRKNNLLDISTTIKDHPKSYYLLYRIGRNRYSYSKDELRNIYSLFDKKVQTSRLGLFIRDYLNSISENKLIIKNFILTDPTNNKESIIDPNKKINIIIFWGSWCGPCRQEIPQLKNFYSSVSKDNLHMISVSINDKKNNWVNALGIENMSWSQLYADAHQSEELKFSLNIPSVPLLIITSSDGKELYRQNGTLTTIEGLHDIVDSLLKL